jgi:hypothetical protein
MVEDRLSLHSNSVLIKVTADNHSSAQIALTFGRVPGMMWAPLVL